MLGGHGGSTQCASSEVVDLTFVIDGGHPNRAGSPDLATRLAAGTDEMQNEGITPNDRGDVVAQAAG
ncbi:hypothetical protein FBY41_0081 [Humibacillus xanthopallidus]|uniref:Uncharacterized protein n=1 Tax=Humibacillus xanthopallidus TaxID=412689 RepID=A0A543HZR0_9MICO|nr:hypothetical protein FBY41_0081 [Humibacillus xanthopallidus]